MNYAEPRSRVYDPAAFAMMGGPSTKPSKVYHRRRKQTPPFAEIWRVVCFGFLTRVKLRAFTHSHHRVVFRFNGTLLANPNLHEGRAIKGTPLRGESKSKRNGTAETTRA